LPVHLKVLWQFVASDGDGHQRVTQLLSPRLSILEGIMHGDEDVIAANELTKADLLPVL
jgi:hypothetical protein